MVIVKRALLSCYDKTGLDLLARELAACKAELIASGGTAEFLQQHGIHLKTVEEFAGAAEQLDGRVKTLHPKIHAGILARRDNPSHVSSVGEHGLIDLVVVNLYPFEETIQRPGISLEEAIEQIDIGGVALLRAAAKNFAHVAVVSNPSQYQAVADALARGKGELPESLARELAVTAFHLTSRYDAWIANYLGASATPLRRTPAGALWWASADQATVSIMLRKQQALRYGENPHQRGTWYVPAAGPSWGLATLQQLQGKELSYNNLLDVDAAFRCLLDCEAPTCAIIKHHAQCGMASAETVREAYERAYACDAESAFGGVVGFNRAVGAELAERLTATFLEVVVAPAIEPEALPIFQKKSNLRVVTLQWPKAAPDEPEWRHLSGTWLLQAADRLACSASAMKIATARPPTERERDDLLFAWTAVKHLKSNGVVLVQDRATVGIGQGQPSRVGSVRLAIEKAGGRSRGAVAASDGFFPFPDGVELLARAGVTAVIQPGGSIRDAEVIEAANRSNLAMALTGIRHFRH